MKSLSTIYLIVATLCLSLFAYMWQTNHPYFTTVAFRLIWLVLTVTGFRIFYLLKKAGIRRQVRNLIFALSLFYLVVWLLFLSIFLITYSM